MGFFRIRSTVRILPGVSINLGKKGASVSVGVRGAHVTIGPTGTRQTVGLPGTGVSYTQVQTTRGGSAHKFIWVFLFLLGLAVLAWRLLR